MPKKKKSHKKLSRRLKDADPNKLMTITLNRGEQATISYRFSPTSRQNGLYIYGPGDVQGQWLVTHGGDWSPSDGQKTIKNTSQKVQSWYLADIEVWPGDPGMGSGALGHQAYFWGDPVLSGAFVSSGGYGAGSGISDGCSDVLALIFIQREARLRR